MTTKIEELEKEIERLRQEKHNHFEIIVAEGKPFIQEGDFNRNCDKCLELNEKDAELKGLKEGIEIGRQEKTVSSDTMKQIVSAYDKGRQETLAEVEKMIKDDHNSREDILKKLQEQIK